MTTYTLAEVCSFLVSSYDALKRRLSLRLGSDERAADVLHDTYLKLQGRDDMAPVRSPQAFLLRTALNIAVDYWRQERHLLAGDEIDELLDLEDPGLGPAQQVQDQAELASLVRIMEKMPARQREILLAVRLEGDSEKSLAARYGISVRMVQKELRAAHDYCARRLDRQGGSSK